MGQWLRAGLLDQRELRDRLKVTLNGGESSGWNNDEPAVVGFVCEIAVRKLFTTGLDMQAVTAFVTNMRSRIHSTAPPDQHVCETLIRDALGAKVDYTNVSVREMFHAQWTIAGMAVVSLGLDEATIDEMIVEGERRAFDAGWHPPLAHSGQRASSTSGETRVRPRLVADGQFAHGVDP